MLANLLWYGSIAAGVVAAISFGLWFLDVFHKLGRIFLVVSIIFTGVSLALGLSSKNDEMGYTLHHDAGTHRFQQDFPYTDCQKCIYMSKEGIQSSCFCKKCGLFQ